MRNDKDHFTLIEKSLQQAVDHAKGKITLKTTKIKMPAPAPEVTPEAIVKIRKKFGMSQAVFAKVLNITTDTESKWEQGLRHPNGAALRLLQIIKKNPSITVNV